MNGEIKFAWTDANSIEQGEKNMNFIGTLYFFTSFVFLLAIMIGDQFLGGGEKSEQKRQTDPFLHKENSTNWFYSSDKTR